MGGVAALGFGYYQLQKDLYKTSSVVDNRLAALSSELVGSQAILKGVQAVFPEIARDAVPDYWCGLRPASPDGVPVIGPTRFRNLFLNTGHGTLGWTMAAGSGRLVADLVSGRTPEISTEGLTLDRFRI